MRTTKFLAITLFFSLISMTSYAQLKMQSTGRILIGQEPTAYTYDAGNVVTVGLLGKGGGNYGPGSKLAFGDVGQAVNGGLNAFIGEFGTYDSDILNPHGRNGIYFTIGGEADYVIAKMEATQLNVFGLVKSYGTTLTSDIRLKKNIKAVPTGISLNNIKKLSAITYDYKTDSDDSLVIELNKKVGTNDKEKKGIEKMKKDLAEKKVLLSNQIGFSAQDLQKIYPELVTTDSDGFLSVNYTGLIPVLVEALKEQQAVIDSQKTTIDTLQKDMTTVKKKLGL